MTYYRRWSALCTASSGSAKQDVWSEGNGVQQHGGKHNPRFRIQSFWMICISLKTLTKVFLDQFSAYQNAWQAYWWKCPSAGCSILVWSDQQRALLLLFIPSFCILLHGGNVQWQRRWARRQIILSSPVWRFMSTWQTEGTNLVMPSTVVCILQRIKFGLGAW